MIITVHQLIRSWHDMWWHGVCTGSLWKGSQIISRYCVRTKPLQTLWKLSRPCMYQIDHIVAPQISRLPRRAPNPFCWGLRPWKLAWHLANLLPSVRLNIVLKRKNSARSWSEAGHKNDLGMMPRMCCEVLSLFWLDLFEGDMIVHAWVCFGWNDWVWTRSTQR